MKNEGFQILGFVLAIGAIIGFAYWIGTSDLPFWVKFALLK